nr:ROK family protein [Nocardioides panaciterrulae]
MEERQQAWPTLDGLARDLSLEVLIRGPLPRRELAAKFGVSAATLTRTVAPLIERGVLIELEEPLAGGLGRPARLLDVPASTHRFVGLKLTGDCVHGVLTDLRAQIAASRTVQLETLEPARVAEQVARLVEQLDTGRDATAVGISFGGVSHDGRTVARAPFLDWHQVPLAELVEQATGLPVILENDLVALAGAEHWFGEGRTVSSFAVLTIGIGVGYGLVVHDRVVTHRDVGVGLVGHYPLDPQGPRCPSGHHGCAEAMLTTTGISSQVSVAHRRPVGYDEALELARQGDPVALQVVTAAGHALGRLIAAVANLAMPERIFLSGEGIELARLVWASVWAGVQRDRDPAASTVDVAVQPYDSDQWARGAAAIAIQHHVLGSASTR